MTENSNPFTNQEETQEPQQAKRLEQVSQAVGFDVPVEVVPLPSKGRLYPPDHPLYNAESVEIKCMTAKEEDIMTSSALIKKGTVISALIESCLLNKSVDAGDLLLGDRNAILIAIRITGYGSEYEASVVCPSCGEQFENMFSLSGLQIKGLETSPVEPNTNLFSFMLPVSKKEVLFKLLTGTDTLNSEKDAERKRKKLGSAVEKNITSRLFSCVLAIDGVADRSKLLRMVENLPARDARALRKHIASIEPDIEMNSDAVCPHCEEEREYDIPLSRNFFWPED